MRRVTRRWEGGRIGRRLMASNNICIFLKRFMRAVGIVGRRNFTQVIRGEERCLGVVLGSENKINLPHSNVPVYVPYLNLCIGLLERLFQIETQYLAQSEDKAR